MLRLMKTLYQVVMGLLKAIVGGTVGLVVITITLVELVVFPLILVILTVASPLVIPSLLAGNMEGIDGYDDDC